MDVVYNNPNKLTIKAMREARENRELETLNSENLETLISSL
jgi:antitoxin component of RelBE/YafQ-DinJ toxin-antitoxin module